jgi:Domain of Unknown Function (DUF326)
MNSRAKLFCSKSSMMLPSVFSPSLSSQRSSSSLALRVPSSAGIGPHLRPHPVWLTLRMTVRDIIDRHPREIGLDRGVLLACIESCVDCAATCTACADACLGEPDVPEMVGCVRRCLDCADVCAATGRVVTRQTEPDLGVVRAAVEACAVACRVCAEECDRHAPHHDHCRVSAEVCRSCEQACRDLLAAIG